jgi:hypothetical protein
MKHIMNQDNGVKEAGCIEGLSPGRVGSYRQATLGRYQATAVGCEGGSEDGKVGVGSEGDGGNKVGSCSGVRRSERIRERKERDEKEVVEVEEREIEKVWKKVKTDGEAVPLYGDVDGEVFCSDPIQSVVDWEVGLKWEMVEMVDRNEEVRVEAKVEVQDEDDGQVEVDEKVDVDSMDVRAKRGKSGIGYGGTGGWRVERRSERLQEKRVREGKKVEAKVELIEREGQNMVVEWCSCGCVGRADERVDEVARGDYELGEVEMNGDGEGGVGVGECGVDADVEGGEVPDGIGGRGSAGG